MTAEIALRGGRVALVDDSDVELLANYKWCAFPAPHGVIYAYHRPRSRMTRLWMHRLIMGVVISRDVVDHVNHDGLDNRRENLRVCRQRENQMNQRPIRGGSSRFKGVSWSRRAGKWVAGVRDNGRKVHLGYFDNEVAAAAAYDSAARHFYGEYAFTNADSFGALATANTL